VNRIMIVSKRRSGVLVFLAILLSLAGMIVSGILLQHHVVAQIGGDPLLGGVCEATAKFSCDEVIASEWGKITLVAGERRAVIPTAMVGFAFFAAVFAWFVCIGMPEGRRRWLHVVPTLGLLAGLAGAAGFEYIMFAVLGKLCPLCMATHLAILLLFVVTLLLWRRGKAAPVAGSSGEAGDAARVPAAPYPIGRMLLATLTLAAVTTGLGWFIYKAQLHAGYANEYYARWQDYNKDTRFLYDQFLQQPRVDIAIHPDDPVRGPADAKHTVVVFSDFLCPFCKGLASMLEQREKEFPGEFRVVFKHFPLDKSCNPDLKSNLHPGACVGAASVEAIRLLAGNDAFWTMHDFVFGGTKFSAEAMIQQAEKMGIARSDYIATIQKPTTMDHVKFNIAEGRRLGLQSTPNLFVDGRQMTKGWGDRHLWRYLLSDETLNTPSSQPATTQPTTTQPVSATQPATSPGPSQR